MNEKDLIKALKREFGWGTQNADGAVRAKFCCEYCGCYLLNSLNEYDSWQIDHISPKNEVFDESLDNIALSCRTCNHLKHNFSPLGATRTERLNNAKSYIMEKRAIKQQELQRLKNIIDATNGEKNN